jgi:hypothetical protein
MVVLFLLQRSLFFTNECYLGLLFYLRLVNVFFCLYSVNRTIKMNLAEGKKNSSLIVLNY